MSEQENTSNDNQEENPNKPKPEKAKNFRKTHGYSLTMSKLMKKWNCASIDAWRTLRNKHKKDHYVGPKTNKKRVPKEVFQVQQDDRNRGNRNGGKR